MVKWRDRGAAERKFLLSLAQRSANVQQNVQQSNEPPDFENFAIPDAADLHPDNETTQSTSNFEREVYFMELAKEVVLLKEKQEELHGRNETLAVQMRAVITDNAVLKEMVNSLQEQVAELKQLVIDGEKKVSVDIQSVKKTLTDRFRSQFPDEPVITINMISPHLQFDMDGTMNPPHQLQELFLLTVKHPKPASVVLKAFVKKIMETIYSTEELSQFSLSKSCYQLFPIEVFTSLRDKLFRCLPAENQSEEYKTFLHVKVQDQLKDMFSKARMKIKNMERSHSQEVKAIPKTAKFQE